MTWWDRQIKFVKEYNGLFRRSHFVAMMYRSKKEHEMEMEKALSKCRKQLHDLSKEKKK